MITESYNLDLIPGGVPVRVPVSQYDAGSRDITFSLYSGGMAFAVPSNAVVTCDGAKPDRKGFSYVCGYSGSTVTVTVTEQMTAVPGEADCQITIRKDGQVLGSANFLLVVERAALPDGADMSETDIAAFTQIANQAAESAQKAQEVISTLDDHKAALDASTEAATTANTNLTESTSAANTARTKLTTATNNANTAKGDLETATGAANTAKDALAQPTADAQAAKTGLDAANQTAADNLEALNDSAAMAQKISKVSPATAGNLAVLTADGGVTDIGKKPTPAGLGALPGTESSTAGCYTRTVDGVTEWINPPMAVGVEYRTTERYNGKALYTKLLDLGALPVNSSKSVSTGLPSGTSIVYVQAFAVASGNMLPLTFAEPNQAGKQYATCWITGSGQTINTYTSYPSITAQAAAIIKYYKS